jgi:DNA polymerase elongation subunit (family B)
MKDIAVNLGFEIVYGDTDSLFLYNKKNYAGNDNHNTYDIISQF